MAEEPRYGIGDLAALGGVSRRTVRYYVQEGLLPQPLGVGRGDHYGPAHLSTLLRVKALQESGRTLGEIRRLLDAPVPDVRHLLTLPAAGGPRRPGAPPPSPALPRALWRRLELAPGVELHVSTRARLPSPSRLQELATWCRLHMAGSTTDFEGEE
jgi:DNA-binding transcriptional MerR regulator